MLAEDAKIFKVGGQESFRWFHLCLSYTIVGHWNLQSFFLSLEKDILSETVVSCALQAPG